MTSSRDYWLQLFSNLVNASPVDTRNMVTHITMFESENEFVIEIAAPYASNPKSKKSSYNGKSDYAFAVNYTPSKSTYHWVEKQVKLTENIINGKSKYLGGGL